MDMSDEPGDEELSEELRRLAAQADPVPPLLVQAAIDAFSWRDIDAELAELVFDSLFDTDEATLVRSSPDRRMVSFKTAELTIDVEVSVEVSVEVAGAEGGRAEAGGRSVMGQIIPPQRATVEIRHREGGVTIEADELGRFQSGTLRSGPMSLRLRPAGSGEQPAVVTDWVSI
jgi:hypothetical protein